MRAIHTGVSVFLRQLIKARSEGCFSLNAGKNSEHRETAGRLYQELMDLTKPAGAEDNNPLALLDPRNTCTHPEVVQIRLQFTSIEGFLLCVPANQLAKRSDPSDAAIDRSAGLCFGRLQDNLDSLGTQIPAIPPVSPTGSVTVDLD